MIYIIDGVIGAGKTTVGKLLAEKLGVVFHDADDYQTHEHRKQLSNGIPLTEKEWKNWLFAIRAIVDRELARGGNAVIAVSVLKEQYRKLLMHDMARMKLVFLKGAKELIEHKLKTHQSHHNASPLILESQLKMVEEPKNALIEDIAKPPEQIVEEILRAK